MLRRPLPNRDISPVAYRLRHGITALLLGLLLAGCGEPESDLNKVIELHAVQASTYLKSGQFRAAGIEASNLIKKAPNQPDGFILLARTLNEQGRHKDALEVLQRCPESAHASWDYVQALANAQIGRGKFQSAQKLLQQHSAHKQQYSANYLKLEARTFIGLGEFDSASNSFRQLIKQTPDPATREQKVQQADALVGLARIVASQGEEAYANQYLEEAVALDPRSVDAGILKAQIAISKNQLEVAESHLTETLLNLKDTDIITPRKANVLQALADVLIKQGRSAEALAYTQVLAESFPGYDIAEEEFQRATALYEQGGKDEAESVLEKIVEDYPGFEKAALMLAVLKYEKKDYMAATELFNPNVDPELASSEVAELAALANLRTNQPEKVLAMLDPVIRGSKNSQLLAIYGGAALGAGQMEKASEALQRALRENPDNIFALTTTAELHLASRPPNYAEAKAMHQRAIALQPENFALLNQLVRTQLLAGEQEQAEAIVSQQLEKNPDKIESSLLAGDFSQAIGDLGKAEQHYRNAQQIDSQSYSAAIKLAALQVRAGKSYGDIENAYFSAIALQPENLLAYKQLITVSNNRRQLDRTEQRLAGNARKSGYGQAYALLALFHAQKSNPQAALEYLSLLEASAAPARLKQATQRDVNHRNSLTYLESGSLDEAKGAVFKALEVDPQSTQLFGLLTEIEIASEDYNEALRLARQIQFRDKPLSLQLQGRIAMAQAQWQDAIEFYRQSWDLSATEAAGQNLAALLKQHQPGEYDQFIQQWLQSIPDSVAANLVKARDLLVSNQLDQAIPLMQKIRQLQPSNAANLNNLAWALDQKGDSSALSIAKNAYELSPENANILDTYGWILHRNQQGAKAVEILGKAAQLAPDNKEIAQHLAEAKVAAN